MGLITRWVVICPVTGSFVFQNLFLHSFCDKNPKRRFNMKKILLIILLPIMFVLLSCSDPTRCDNSGCEYRKAGYYLMKDYPSMSSHSSMQTGYDRKKHAYRGKEFCSNAHAKEYYRKL